MRKAGVGTATGKGEGGESAWARNTVLNTWKPTVLAIAPTTTLDKTWQTRPGSEYSLSPLVATLKSQMQVQAPASCSLCHSCYIALSSEISSPASPRQPIMLHLTTLLGLHVSFIIYFYI